ncbi:MAG: hypothetical protein C4346_07445, partial [Chloroflexota bacterium]
WLQGSALACTLHQPRCPARARVRSRFARSFAIATAVLLALVASVLLASGLRLTVADVLGVRGIRIVIERAHPTVPPT